MNREKIEKELKEIHNNIERDIKRTLTGFKRNVGKGGGEFAILDRDILKNIYLPGLIKEIPFSISQLFY